MGEQSKLESIANHLSHIQKRIDVIQGSIDGMVQILVETLAENRATGPETLNAHRTYFLDLVERIRAENVAKYSEFPYTNDETSEL